MSAAAAAVPVLSWNFHCLEGVGGDLVGEASVGTIHVILSRKKHNIYFSSTAKFRIFSSRFCVIKNPKINRFYQHILM